MPSRRRSAIVAVLVLLAGLAFAGCGRAQPGTAAYVGNVRITEDRIDEMVDEVRRAAQDRTPDDIRVEVVRVVVAGELARQTARELSLPMAEPSYDEIARSSGLPADFGVVHAIAEAEVAGSALIAKATPVQPTERDLRDIYEGLLANGAIAKDVTFEEVAGQVRTNARLPSVLGARDLMEAHAEKVGLEINPRYRPLVAAIGNLGVPVLLAGGIGVRNVT